MDAEETVWAKYKGEVYLSIPAKDTVIFEWNFRSDKLHTQSTHKKNLDQKNNPRGICTLVYQSCAGMAAEKIAILF